MKGLLVTSGKDGFIVGADVTEFLASLRHVAEGGTAIDPEVVALVLKRMIKDRIEVTEFHREERKLEDARFRGRHRIQLRARPEVA